MNETEKVIKGLQTTKLMFISVLLKTQSSGRNRLRVTQYMNGKNTHVIHRVEIICHKHLAMCCKSIPYMKQNKPVMQEQSGCKCIYWSHSHQYWVLEAERSGDWKVVNEHGALIAYKSMKEVFERDSLTVYPIFNNNPF